MRSRLAATLGAAAAAAAASLACFNANAPAAPCTDYRGCPGGQHCDPIAHRCASPAVAPAVIASFTASPARVPCGSGSVATLTAIFSGGTGTIEPGVGAVSSGDSHQVPPPGPTATQGTVYTLTVINDEKRPTTRSLTLYSSNVFSGGPALDPAPVGSDGATATRLLCGKVLLAGGSSARTAALFDAFGPQGKATLDPIGSLQVGRKNATATLLRDGRVLIAGGAADKSVELFAGPDLSPSWDRCSGTFKLSAAELLERRSFAAATLLSNGKVLIAGGGDGAGGGALDSAELVDPAGPDGALAIRAAGTMTAARTRATATALYDGRVLIAGGFGKDGLPLTSAELYDPAGNGGAGSFRAAGSLVQPRGAATATLLPSGRVLFVGGSVVNASGVRTGALDTAELYDPSGDGGAGSSTSVGARLSTARSDASATLLGNGQVLVVGGREAGQGDRIASAELFDPAGGGSGTFSDVCPPLFPGAERLGAAAALLPDGRVLVAGGQSSMLSTQLFDPAGLGAPDALGTFSAGGGDNAWFGFRATATLLPSGKVLIAGGTGPTALYDPPGPGKPGSFVAVDDEPRGREGMTATLLRDGRVLLAGGYYNDFGDIGSYLSDARIFTPAAGGAGSFASTGSLQTGRADAAAVLLPDGRVVVFGGRSIQGPVNSAEVFDPAGNGGLGSFRQVEWPIIEPGFLSTATLLPTGEVLLAGGTGRDGSSRASAHLFDPAGDAGKGSFDWPPPDLKRAMLSARSGATATLLPNGKVLLAGGQGEGNAPTDTAELYDVSSGQFTPAGRLSVARAMATATLLPNGKVLIVGGTGPAASSAELYDPFAGKFLGPVSIDFGTGPTERATSAAVLLQDGRVLIASGNSATPFALLFSLE